MRELIIHADDYGLTGSVSEGILQAHAHGLVTSTSILMTHVTPKELAWARAEPTCDFGLHLNCTSGVPCAALSDVPALVGERRTFSIPRQADPGSPHKRFDFGAIPERELRRELEAQIAAGLATGLPLSHLDTHHHIHRDPRIFALLCDYAAAHRWAIRALDAGQVAQCYAAGIPTTGHFLGGWFGQAAIQAPTMLDAVDALPADSTAELMCHPGQMSETLELISGYHQERAQELAVLTDPALRLALRERDIRLIGWGDLLH